MVTIREYAEQHNVSYEAVRKQIKRYEARLDGHIVIQGRTQYLDEYAEDFLDQKRATNPVTIYETERTNAIEQLRDENKALLIQIAELQQQIIAAKDREIQQQQALLEARAAQARLASTEQDLEEARKQIMTDQERITADQVTIAELRAAKESAEAEANSYERSWFGFYRKK